ncbi:MAG: ankyrin repeat domain-containing protein [Coxiellaceae bacterium]|nr:ankyrin repeat domain-containing protein [Coxiellaceae bacterium]
MRTPWQTAIATHDVRTIKLALKSGQRPDSLDSTFIVNDGWRSKSVSIVEVTLMGNSGPDDIEYFDLAQQLLDAGAPLPELDTNEGGGPLSLKQLAGSPKDLFIAQHRNPAIVTQQCDFGKTIAHYIACQGQSNYRPDIARLLQSLLFTLPGLNLNIKDKEGNTALHSAAMYSHYSFTLPQFAEAAVKNGYDFEGLNDRGLTVLHTTARADCKHEVMHHLLDDYDDDDNTQLTTMLLSKIQPFLYEESTHPTEALLKAMGGHANVETLSRTGSTALYYAVRQQNFSAASALLGAGANPLAGRENKKAYHELQQQMKVIESYISLMQTSGTDGVKTWLTTDGGKAFVQQQLGIDTLVAESTLTSTLQALKTTCKSHNLTERRFKDTFDIMQLLLTNMKFFIKRAQTVNEHTLWESKPTDEAPDDAVSLHLSRPLGT